MLGIQNENVICIFELKVFNKASEENIHHVHINLPESIPMIPASNENNKSLSKKNKVEQESSMNHAPAHKYTQHTCYIDT